MKLGIINSAFGQAGVGTPAEVTEAVQSVTRSITNIELVGVTIERRASAACGMVRPRPTMYNPAGAASASACSNEKPVVSADGQESLHRGKVQCLEYELTVHEKRKGRDLENQAQIIARKVRV